MGYTFLFRDYTPSETDTYVIAYSQSVCDAPGINCSTQYQISEFGVVNLAILFLQVFIISLVVSKFFSLRWLGKIL